MLRRLTWCLAAAALVAAAGAPAPALGFGAGPREVDVMTFNMAAARHTGSDLEPIASVIEAAQPDVVALQEVDRFWSRTGSVDQPAVLAERLRMHYVFDPNFDCLAEDVDVDGVCQYGTAMLSRLPIDPSSVRRYSLPLGRGEPTRLGGRPEPRGLLRAVVRVHGRPLEVFTTHLGLKPATRRLQIGRIMRIAGGHRGPLVLLGDLNAAPFFSEMKPLFRRFTDAQAVGGSRRQRTTAYSRIDYVFTSPNIQVLGARVIPNRVSDHRPVIAELRLPR